MSQVLEAIIARNISQIQALQVSYGVRPVEVDICSTANVTLLESGNLPNINSLLKNNTLVVCRDGDFTAPWMTSDTDGFYVRYMDLLVKELRLVYNNPTLDYTWYTVDTSKGWFDLLKGSVDSGDCSVLISTATVLPERASQVHFGCSFAATRDAFLRGELDSNLALTSTDDLNFPNVKICVQTGTSYYDEVKKSYNQAKVTVVESQTECYPLITSRQVHVTFCDRFCLKAWYDQNRAQCQGCRIISYGDAGQFALMYTKGDASSQNGYPAKLLIAALAVLYLLL